MNIVVSYPVGPEGRARAAVHLGQDRICWLEDVAETERSERLRTADVLVAYNVRREIRPEEWPLLGNLSLFQAMFAGVENLPFELIPEKAAICANVGAWADPIAEHALGMALALGKHFSSLHDKLRHGEFDRHTLSTRFRGKVCGILGFGGIGKKCAALFRALGMRIHALNSSGVADEPVDFIGDMTRLDEVLRTADVLVLALPLTRNTRNLLDAAKLALMKDDAILVNVARAGLVDERALYDRLHATPTFRAAFDVWWQEPEGETGFATETPLLELPNMLGSPHNSNVVEGIDDEALGFAMDNVRRFLNGERLAGLVNRNDYR